MRFTCLNYTYKTIFSKNKSKNAKKCMFSFKITKLVAVFGIGESGKNLKII